MQDLNDDLNLAESVIKIPIKSILKKSNKPSAQDLVFMNTSPQISPNSAIQTADYNKRMTWDEMNILATYHPPDKDYGFMKVDEPLTPYNNNHNNNNNMNDEEICSDEESNDGVDAFKLEEELNLNREKLPKYMQEKMSLSEEIDENDATRNQEFESQRKLHYNEFKMAQLLKTQMNDDDDEDDDENV